MSHLEEREAHAILEGVDRAAGLAPIGGIEFGRGSAPRYAIKPLEMRDGKLILALVRFARAVGTINAMYQIENLCPPQIAVFCTLQLPIKRGNRFTSKKRVNHMTPNGNRAPRMSHKRHLGRTGGDRGATHRGA